MVYEPLYHAREIATIKLPSAGCSCKAKSARSNCRSSNVFVTFLIIQLFHSSLLDLRMMYCLMSDPGVRNPSFPNRSGNYDLPITNSDALGH